MPCRSFRLLFLVFLALLAPLATAAAQGTTDCIGAARPGWAPPESWVWRQICAGKKADLEIGFPPERGESRALSAGFITALLFDPQLKLLVPHSGVHIWARRLRDRCSWTTPLRAMSCRWSARASPAMSISTG